MNRPSMTMLPHVLSPSSSGHGGRRAAALAIAAAMLLALAPTAHADRGKSRIHALDHAPAGTGAPGALRIRIRGTHEPTFTVYKLDYPARVVVDIAGAELDQKLTGEAESKATWALNTWAVGQLAVYELHDVANDGTSQGSQQSLVRVVVGMARPGSYRAEASGKDVVVTVTPEEPEPAHVSPENVAAAARAVTQAETRHREVMSKVEAAERRKAAAETAAAEAERRAEQARALREREEAAYRQVSEARAEAERRAEQARALREREETAYRQVSDARTEAERRAAATSQAGKRLDALQAAVDAAQTKVAEMRQAAAEAERRAAAVNERKDATEREIERARGEARRLAEAHAQAEGALVARRNEVAAQEREVARLGKARADGEAALRDLSASAEKARVARQAEEKRIAELADRRQRLETELESARKAVRTAQAEWQARKSEAEAELRALSQAVDQARSKRLHEESRITDLSERRKALETEIDQIRQVRARADAQVEAKQQAHLRELDAATVKARQAREGEEAKLAELSKRRKELEAELGRARAQAQAAARAEHEAQKSEVEAERRVLEQAAAQARKAQAEEAAKVAELSKRRKELEAELDKVRTETRAEAEAGRAAREARVEAESELRALDSAAVKARQARESEEAKIAELARRRKELEAELERARVEARARAEAERVAQQRAREQEQTQARAEAERAAQRAREQEQAKARVEAERAAQLAREQEQAKARAEAERTAQEYARKQERAKTELRELDAAATKARRAREAEEAKLAELAKRREELEQALAKRAREQQAARVEPASPPPAATAEPAVASRSASASAPRSASASAPRPEPTTAQRSASASAPRPEPATAARIEDVDFVDEKDVARVVIAMSRDVQPRIVSAEGGRVIMEIDGATLPAALQRTLDTSAYHGPIRSLSSYRAADDENKMRLVVDLAYPAKHVLKRSGKTYYWDFVKSADRQRQAAPTAEASKPRRSGSARAQSIPAPVVGGYGASSTPITQKTVAQLANQRRRVYRGTKIDLDLKDVDIHNVMRLLADVGGINVVIPDDIKASVTVRLRQVPWDQALEVVLASKGLWYRREGNLYRIATRKELDAEDQAEAERLAAMVKAEAPEPQVFTLNYSVAEEIKPQLEALLSPKGRIEVDERTNSLIINDVRAHRRRIIDLLTRLDTQTPQIQIEARIVEARSTFTREFGVQWGGSFLDANTGLIFPGSVGVVGGNTDNQTVSTGVNAASPDFAVNLPAATGTGAGGAVGFAFGSVNGAVNITLRLSALEDIGSVRIISAPKITVLNNVRAEISQGVSIPISVISANGVQTQFVQADLSLKVTPHVSQRDCSIQMELEVQKNEADFVNTGARGDPTILRKEAKTTVLVADNETTVIGGIYTRNSGLSFSKVPFFGDLPLVGWFFKNRRENDERTEVLVFITPRITNKAFLRCE